MPQPIHPKVDPGKNRPYLELVMSSEVDSTTDNWVITLSRNNYTFQQELFAAKIGMRIGEKFYWDINYIKVEDNIDTVVDTMLNAVILIPPELQSSEDEISYNNLRIIN